MSPTEEPTPDVSALYDAAHEATAAGDQAGAIALCEQALVLQPAHPGVLELLGFWRLQQKRWGDAITLLLAARQAGGDNVELLNHLATAYYRSGDLRMAATALGTALKHDPLYLDTHLHFASLLLEVRQLAPARMHAERALSISPRRYECLLWMGLLCRAEDRCSEALRWFEQAEAVAPMRVEAPMNAGVVYQEMGLPADAIAAFERALQWHPQEADLYSNRLFTMNYLSGWNAEAWFAAHCGFEQAIRIPRRGRLPASRKREDQRCRIGYVSNDLRNSAVARFLLPVLRRHDHTRFHVTCYYSGRVADETTRVIAGLCEVFRPVVELNDQELLEQIAGDDIDVLIDLSGHSNGNRLPVFAAGAAPVQATWLGYLGSTGLSSIHYRLTDATVDPAGVSEGWHTEKLVRLPRCIGTYEPYAVAPAVTSLPMHRNGHITFGALNNPAKVSDVALHAWATILQRVPDSRLVLMARGDDAVRQRFMRPFLLAGMTGERVTLLKRLPTRDYLEAYGGIDIAFDAFPYGGATTVCDALWQGVPVLAVQSLRPFGRSAATILHQVGLDDWLADSANALIDLALRKAGPQGIANLDGLRQSLRSRMQASPLLDAAAFTRELEAALDAMWTNHQP